MLTWRYFDLNLWLFPTSLNVDHHLHKHLPLEMLLALPFHYVGLLAPLNRAMARSGTLGAVYQTGIEHTDG